MLAYPITLEKDGRAWLATSPDFPESTTFGADREDAIACAAHALEEAIAARIHDRKDIPTPSQGDTYAILPTLTSIKVMLYQEMREQGVGKAELARRTGWHLPQVDRALDVQHRSRFDMMDAALKAVGKILFVTVTDTSDPVRAGKTLFVTVPDLADLARRRIGKKLVVTVTDTSDPVIESTGQEKEAIGAM